jgi:hypothetical protein
MEIDVTALCSSYEHTIYCSFMKFFLCFSFTGVVGSHLEVKPGKSSMNRTYLLLKNEKMMKATEVYDC